MGGGLVLKIRTKETRFRTRHLLEFNSNLYLNIYK